MSYDHFVESTCTRKVKYASQARAEVAIAYLHKRCPEGDATLAAYPCRVCGQWHVGHVPISPLDKLPRIQGHEFVGVRKDNGQLVYCTTLINLHGNILVIGPVGRNELKGWIEDRWFAD